MTHPDLPPAAPESSFTVSAPAASEGAGPSSLGPVYLIDGSGYIFRAYYAMRRLTTSNGQSTNAVFGFTTMLLKILKERRPAYIGIAFDVGGKNFRHEMYPEYKANRSAPPEDLPPQIPLIRQLVTHMQIPVLVKQGVEADDVLASMAKRARAAGHDVVIVTGDKDLMQLVDDHVILLDELRMKSGQNESAEVRRAEVIAKFGVPPEKVVDVLALAGDASDNVPGVSGIGEKTAAELIQQFGSLDALLNRVDEIKQPARREKLRAQADVARLSRDLVVIRDDVEIDVDLEQLRYRGPDRAALRNFFVEMEFRRLVTDPIVTGETPSAAAPAPAQKVSRTAAARAAAGQAGGQGDLFGGAAPAAVGGGDGAPVDDEGVAAQVLKTLAHDGYRLVDTEDALLALLRDLAPAPRIALRSEVDAPGPRARLVGIALSWAFGQAAYIPASAFPIARMRDALTPLLQDVSKTAIAHDGKSDVNTLFAEGFSAWALRGDPMLASYLLDADADSHSVSQVARRFLGMALMDDAAVLGSGKNAVTLDKVPLTVQVPFVCEAVDATFRVDAVLQPRIEAEGLLPLYRDLELPLEAVLGEMERAGIRVDVGRLKSMSDDFAVELKRIEEKAHASAGRPFNVESPKQVAELLFGELDLPVTKRTKTGPSTDSSVLEALADKHELPALILEHRTLAKLKGTYVDVLPTLIDARGRVHTHFNQAVAATGRLSSTDPNLQNIPIRTELGRAIRDAFIAEEGKVLISLDYSQIELRILAHVSEDPVLLDTFARNLDVHRRTASEIFKKPLEDVTRDERTAAKAINFGLLYGMGVVRLARELGIKRADARQYLDVYFERLAGIRQWHSGALERAHVEKEVRTLFGRRRTLHDIDSKNGGLRARAERLAINTPIQGTAADIMKRAMIDAHAALKAEVPSAEILLQVHDELVIEVPAAHAERTVAVARAAMVGAIALKVPLVVDGHIGRTWNEAH